MNNENNCVRDCYLEYTDILSFKRSFNGHKFTIKKWHNKIKDEIKYF